MQLGGTYDDWTYVAANYRGCSAVYQTVTGGVFQVRVTAGLVGDGYDLREYKWGYTENRDFGCRKRNECKAFGVCDEPWQLSLRNHALQNYLSVEYVPGVELEARYGFSSYDEGLPKCNIFVAHMIVSSGLYCPALHGVHLLSICYPPTANDWCSADVGIGGWVFCQDDIRPQPGYVCAVRGRPMGHCGILDFDGAGISAQGNAVTRRSVALVRGRYRRYVGRPE